MPPIKLYFPSDLFQSIKDYYGNNIYKFFDIINETKNEQIIDELATIQKSVKFPDFIVSILHRTKNKLAGKIIGKDIILYYNEGNFNELIEYIQKIISEASIDYDEKIKEVENKISEINTNIQQCNDQQLVSDLKENLQKQILKKKALLKMKNKQKVFKRILSHAKLSKTGAMKLLVIHCVYTHGLPLINKIKKEIKMPLSDVDFLLYKFDINKSKEYKQRINQIINNINISYIQFFPEKNLTTLRFFKHTYDFIVSALTPQLWVKFLVYSFIKAFLNDPLFEEVRQCVHKLHLKHWQEWTTEFEKSIDELIQLVKEIQEKIDEIENENIKEYNLRKALEQVTSVDDLKKVMQTYKVDIDTCIPLLKELGKLRILLGDD